MGADKSSLLPEMSATAGSGVVTTAGSLVALYFSKQSDPPASVDGLDIGALDPFLRGLLFTDGTVTRALEVHTLSRLALDVVDQATAVVPDHAAQHLQLPVGAECLRRRVIMSLAGAPVVWAESYIVTERLPRDFLALLGDSAHGIGDSLARLKLESWRELLWFELGWSPCWGPTAAHTALIRFYLVITSRRPALLISEAFAVERHSGTYRMPGSNGG